jgi:hypothetical protein
MICITHKEIVAKLYAGQCIVRVKKIVNYESNPKASVGNTI